MTRPAADPYVAYIHRFFGRWVPVYDLFARSIPWAYSAAVGRLRPAPGRRILDLCTGTGEIALRCARRGASVVGLDLTPAMLERAREKSARERLDLVLTVGDARHLEHADRSFDAVSLSFALHDMPRRVRLEVLAEAARVSRGPIVVLDYRRPRAPLFGPLAIRGLRTVETAYFPAFVAEGLESLAADAGLGIEEERVLFPGSFAVWLLQRDHRGPGRSELRTATAPRE